MKIMEIIRKQQMFVIMIILLILGLLGITYAAFIDDLPNKDDQVITTADLDVEYGDSCEVLSGEIDSMSDSEGLSQDGCEISFTNNSTTNLLYTINLFKNVPADFDGELINEDYIRFSIDNGAVHTLSEYNDVTKNSVNMKEIYENIIVADDSAVHNIKIWLADDIPDSENDKYIYIGAKVIGTNTNDIYYTLVDDQGEIGVLDFGDEIAIGNQHFNVIESNEYETKLLSKYNLLVGYKCTRDNNSNCSLLTNATAIQDSTALGWSDSYPSTASIDFSTSNYWGSDKTGEYVYNENSIIYPYINSYKEYLENNGANITEARLITLAEMELIGCDSSALTCASAPSWLFNTSFWTGTTDSSNSDNLWIFDNDDTFKTRKYDVKYYRGVRPVIVVSTGSIILK